MLSQSQFTRLSEWRNKRRIARFRSRLQSRTHEHPVVAVIGNASSFSPNEEQIFHVDNFDLVASLNLGFLDLKGIQNLGAIGMSLPKGKEGLDWLCRAVVTRKIIILLSPISFRGIRSPLAMLFMHLPIHSHEALMTQLGSRPSSGLMAIEFFGSMFGYRSVHVFGFDFWQSPTSYSGKNRPGPHSPASERDWVISKIPKSNLH